MQISIERNHWKDGDIQQRDTSPKGRKATSCHFDSLQLLLEHNFCGVNRSARIWETFRILLLQYISAISLASSVLCLAGCRSSTAISGSKGSLEGQAAGSLLSSIGLPSSMDRGLFWLPARDHISIWHYFGDYYDAMYSRGNGPYVEIFRLHNYKTICAIL